MSQRNQKQKPPAAGTPAAFDKAKISPFAAVDDCTTKSPSVQGNGLRIEFQDAGNEKEFVKTVSFGGQLNGANFDAIPNELTRRRQWVLWREETRNGKSTKVPYQSNGYRADSTDRNTWSTLRQVVAAYKRGGYDGIGIVLADGIAGVDLDKCRDPETRKLEAWAAKIVQNLDSYAEVSPSGRGVHVLAKATLPPKGRRRGQIEMYDSDRYFTLTGDHLNDTPSEICERQVEINDLHRAVFGDPEDHRTPAALVEPVSLADAELIERSSNAANGAKFRKLWAGDWSGYTSQSEADAALCSILAFWTGPDPERIDGLFRQSGLYRPKWERDDYRSRTIALALAGKSEFYSPPGDDTDRPDQKLEALRQHAVSRQWENPRTRETDRTVYLALIERGIEAGTLEVAASSRDTAERAGCGNKTAARALRRLCDSELIELRKPSNGFDAPVYMLRDDTLPQNTWGGGTTESRESVFKAKCVTSLHIDVGVFSELSGDDAFMWSSKLRPDQRAKNEPGGCIGATGRSMIAALEAENGLSFTELAEATGMHRVTASKKAKTLAGLGLVKLTTVGRCAIVWLKTGWREILDGFRHRLTTFGRGLKRRIEHAKARIGHYGRLLRRIPEHLRERAPAIAGALDKAKRLKSILEEARQFMRPEPDGYWRRPKRPPKVAGQRYRDPALAELLGATIEAGLKPNVGSALYLRAGGDAAVAGELLGLLAGSFA